MKQWRKRGLSLLLAAVMTLSLGVSALAAAKTTVDQAVADTAAYIYQTVRSPQIGSVGGEWAVLGLARSGFSAPQAYYQTYYDAVASDVKARGGVLHARKYTEYSRVIIALTAIGKDARNVAGYDLTAALGDYDQTVWQGINGAVWALIALDSGNYPMPQNPEAKTQATRQMYVDAILAAQLPEGGWTLSGSTADPDLTGMALQALAKYQGQSKVKTATEKALSTLSAQQQSDGGFLTQGMGTAESCAQVLVALCELGISLDDARFVKNGHTVLDGLMGYYRAGKGFQHTDGSTGSDQMATEQGFYALVAVQRTMEGKNSLYRMGDAVSLVPESASGTGLPGKHADVKTPAVASGKTFADISTHKNREAIEDLASRGIINGYDAVHFGPDRDMTRAQFAAIVVRGLGLPEKKTSQFTDVSADAWCAGSVGTAYAYGIVNGTTATTFTPNGTITRQEAAVMVARAAKLCGMDTARDASTVQTVLAGFKDSAAIGAWARESLAFCYDGGILDASEQNVRPREAIKRCEVAQMLWNLLSAANLL